MTENENYGDFANNQMRIMDEREKYIQGFETFQLENNGITKKLENEDETFREEPSTLLDETRDERQIFGKTFTQKNVRNMHSDTVKGIVAIKGQNCKKYKHKQEFYNIDKDLLIQEKSHLKNKKHDKGKSLKPINKLSDSNSNTNHTKNNSLSHRDNQNDKSLIKDNIPN